MFRKTIAAVAMTLFASAFAQAETWEFSYTGFYVEDQAKFEPNYTWRGEFSGTDVDDDGVIEFDELSSFRLFIYDYGIGSPDYCDVGTYCELQAFSYHLTGDLSFTTWTRYSDENGSSSTWTIIAGERISTELLRADGSTGSSNVYWTAQTRFEITPPPMPVPEPAAPAMLAAGLAILGVLRYRRGS
ncbi:hypothetical protein [Pseudoduganella sp. GCM10020061]|uniref:hypothetical protein n=1 Tax=Pseudoduganella sp. GCM10020061 TaxID=3317345 RepID=UPI0036456E93